MITIYDDKGYSLIQDKYNQILKKINVTMNILILYLRSSFYCIIKNVTGSALRSYNLKWRRSLLKFA